MKNLSFKSENGSVRLGWYLIVLLSVLLLGILNGCQRTTNPVTISNKTEESVSHTTNTLDSVPTEYAANYKRAIEVKF